MDKPDFQKMVCFLGVTKDLEANNIGLMGVVFVQCTWSIDGFWGSYKKCNIFSTTACSHV